MSDLFTIVPAGAGSGKTFRIKSDLTKWVKNKIIGPERILAVTFTEAAAAELRGRIRSSLLAEGLVEAALAVEQAYVSTIHGLGLRILSEHAFAAGASPRPRLRTGWPALPPCILPCLAPNRRSACAIAAPRRGDDA